MACNLFSVLLLDDNFTKLFGSLIYPVLQYFKRTISHMCEMYVLCVCVFVCVLVFSVVSSASTPALT